MKNGSFRLSDYTASLNFYSNNMKDEEHYKILDVLLNTLKENGFKVQIDQDTLNNYPIIAKDYFEGFYNELAFKSHRYPSGFEIKFFYNTERGEYDFDKLNKMPYLTKLECIKYTYVLKNKLLELGFTDESKKKYKLSEDYIKQKYVEGWHHKDIKDMNFKLSDLDGITCKENYNNKDRDKKIIYNGQIKYFRGYKGYLQRGKVYQNINNMWWVILNDTDYTNIASFELFDINDKDRKSLKKIKRIKKYMNPRRNEYKNQEYRIGDNLFIINCRTGMFKATTEYGCYKYNWSSSDKYKQNLLRFDKGYILDKFSYDKELTEMDYDNTINNWKKTILEWRRNDDLNEEQARNLYNFIESQIDDSMNEEEICRLFYDECSDNDIDYPYEDFDITKKYTKETNEFWKLFEQLRDILKKELEDK